MNDARFIRAIGIGIVVGMAAMFLVATAIVVLGHVRLTIAASIGVWVGFVIGPYAGGLAMLSRVPEEHDEAQGDHHTPLAA